MSAIQTYNTAFPFDVKIQNLYQGELLPVLYIVDENRSAANLMNLQIVITPNSQQQYQFVGYEFSTPQGNAVPVSSVPALAPSNATFKPDANQYNLSFAFRPGVLSDEVIPNFSSILQNALTLAVSANINCVSGPYIRATDGAFLWYCAFQNTLDIPNGLSFQLKGIRASPGAGSRSTQAEVCLNNLNLNANLAPLNFTRSIHLDIVNHQGSSFAPVYFGVLGENALANNASNNLQVYFETLGRVPIQFGPQTTFSFRFSYDTPSSNLMHFGSQSQVNGILWGDTTGQNAVVPFNSANKLNSASNVNFDGQYKNIPTKATDDGSGNVMLAQTFDYRDEITNPEYTSVQAQITAFQNDISSSNAFYTAAEGPLRVIQKLIDAYTSTLDWTKESTNADFLSQLTGLSNAYQNDLFNNSTGSQDILSNIRSSAENKNGDPLGNIDSLLPYFYMDNNTPFSTELFDSNYQRLFYVVSSEYSIQKANGTYIYGVPNRALSFFGLDAIRNAGPNHDYNSNKFYDPQYILNHPNRWTDTAFVNFLTLNYKSIIDNLAASYAHVGDFFVGTKSGVAASRFLYDYLTDVFNAFKKYKQNIYLSNILINHTTGFSKNQWSSSLVNTKNFFATNKQDPTILSADSSTVNSQFTSASPWMDDDFYKYVQTNLPQISNGLTVNSTYLVPSASLFDLFYFHYQLSVYRSLLATIPPTLKFYINPVTCIFNFNSLQLSGQDGTVILHARVENIPGYWDTEFQIPIIKKSEMVSPAASMLAYAGKSTPPGWLKCDGSAINEQYANLIALVGANTPNMTNYNTTTYFWIIKC